MPPADRSRRATSFGAVAEHYDRYRPGPPAEAVEWLLPEGCTDAVDMGAGTGALTRRLLERVPHVYAVEPDARMRTVLAERSPGAVVLEGRAESLPLPDASADAVLGASMWHWVEPAAASTEIARVLRPGGRLGLLWNGPDRRVPWVAELMSAPDRANDAADAARRRVALPPDAPFAEPALQEVEWLLPMTGDELIGLVGTYSGVITLDDDERAALIARVTALVATHPALDGSPRVNMPMRCRSWRADRV